MTPTAQLRFVERDMYVGLNEARTVRILQQWWESQEFDMITGRLAGEWRDIPLEAEDFTQNKTSG